MAKSPQSTALASGHNITKAVTITSPDGVEAGIVAAAGGNAITISAGSNDAIVLRGLTLNGGGTGSNGVVFNSGAGLTVTNCAIQNFTITGDQTTGNGILIAPSVGAVTFVITNTLIANNRYVGIFYRPPSGSTTANGIIDHVVATANEDGAEFDLRNAAGGQLVAAVSNSTFGVNAFAGIGVSNGPSSIVTVTMDNVKAISNNNYGVGAFDTAKIVLSHSVITGNGVGANNQTSSNSFYSYQDNRINDNVTNISSVLNTVAPQ